MVKLPALRVKDLQFNSRLCCWDFSTSSHTSDLKIGTPVVTLSGTRRYTIGSVLGQVGLVSVYYTVTE